MKPIKCEGCKYNHEKGCERAIKLYGAGFYLSRKGRHDKCFEAKEKEPSPSANDESSEFIKL